MGRKEEEGLIMHTIAVQAIAAPTPSGSNISLMEVEYGNQVVTEAPAGGIIDIYVTWTAYNPGALSWEVVVTVVDVETNGQLIANYDRTLCASQRPSARSILDAKGTNYMPNQNITLRFKLWGHDQRNQPLPPQNQW